MWIWAAVGLFILAAFMEIFRLERRSLKRLRKDLDHWIQGTLYAALGFICFLIGIGWLKP